MSFSAIKFTFNRVPCEEYGLCIFDIDGNNNEATPFASVGKLQTDLISSTGRNFLYGRKFESPLEFNLIFGIDPSHSIKMYEHLDRYEMDAIANWLTGPNEYQWLEIEQPDLELIRYHCIISELKPIHVAMIPWAFSAKIVCDSPYGYMYPRTFKYTCSGTTNINLVSRATIQPLYYPKLNIQPNGSNTISIINKSCNNEGIVFTSLPFRYTYKILIDNELEKIECSDASYPNLYQYSNFNWLPLKHGANRIEVSGSCNLEFICEFPVNFGG